MIDTPGNSTWSQISGTTTEPQEELMKNKSKSIYMKQYMQKRRKDKNFRSKERVKERDGKQSLICFLFLFSCWSLK
jgi:hypothetical protein